MIGVPSNEAGMSEFILFLIVGFLAQAVDGALGMAFGAISATVLLSFGVPPAQASASVHTAELFTTAASGSAHLVHRNVDWQLFWRLAPAGIVGGCLGAYVLTSFEGEAVKPLITTYLAVIGLYLIIRSFRKIPSKPVPASVVAPFGAVGGFLDAAGGGGWGAMVTGGLLGAGAPPRYVIGTVNASEFLITLSVSVTFLASLISGHWEATGTLTQYGWSVAGLITGGLFAAPMAGWMVKTVPEKALLRAVGILIVCLSLYQTAQLLP
jgi:uncharacterized membrane protein YfcA